MTNHMAVAIECHVDRIVFRVVGDAEQRRPLGNDLVTELERRHLNLRPLALQRLGHAIEKPPPLRLGHRVRYRHRPVLSMRRNSHTRDEYRTSVPLPTRCRRGVVATATQMAVSDTSSSSPAAITPR